MMVPRSRQRRTAVLLVTVLTATALAATAGAALAAPERTAVEQHVAQEYVAMGDSWTADSVILGPPTTEFVPLGCGQSAVNHPKLVARELGVDRFVDASCGGATSENLDAPQRVGTGETNAPQAARLTGRTDLVTIGIGGNDVEFGLALASCVNLLPEPLGTPCRDRFVVDGVDRISENIRTAEPAVLQRVRTVRERVAPGARIMMVNYLAGLPERGCWPAVQVLDQDMAWLHDKLDEVNAMVARIAHDAGYELVDTFTPSVGHDMCQGPTTRYVEGALPVSVNGPAIAVPFHPNSAGARAQADAVLTALRDGDAGE